VQRLLLHSQPHMSCFLVTKHGVVSVVVSGMVGSKDTPTAGQSQATQGMRMHLASRGQHLSSRGTSFRSCAVNTTVAAYCCGSRRTPIYGPSRPGRRPPDLFSMNFPGFGRMSRDRFGTTVEFPDNLVSSIQIGKSAKMRGSCMIMPVCIGIAALHFNMEAYSTLFKPDPFGAETRILKRLGNFPPSPCTCRYLLDFHQKTGPDEVRQN
jgi:hypothetical protein